MGYTSIRLFLVGILLCIPWYVGFELAQNKVNTQQTAILESKAMHNSILPLRSSEESTQQASVHTVKNSDTNKNTVHPAHQALLTHHQKSVVSKSLETLATTTEDTIMLSDVPSPKTPQKMGITPGMMDGKFSITEILDAQNIARAEVGVPSLFWSTSLAQGAQAWADTLASQNCTLSHDPHTPYGENLASRWVTGSTHSGLISTPKEIVSLWTSEKQFYEYTHNTCKDGETCGHYTQLIWKDSTEVGCAVSTCFDASSQKQTDVWVCRYNPAGNMQGEKPY
jgi:pathogenesis-related protein 1